MAEWIGSLTAGMPGWVVVVVVIVIVVGWIFWHFDDTRHNRSKWVERWYQDKKKEKSLGKK